MEANEVFNESYSKYYNLFYADKNYSAEVDYIDRLIRIYDAEAKSLLEYGSGTGGHGLLLKEKGYNIVGIEKSNEMATIAMSKGLECYVADVVSYKLSKQFDVCIALFHVISYINSNDDLIKTFNNTGKHLKEKGLFVFDVWFTPAVFYQKPEIRRKKIEKDEITVSRVARPMLDHDQNVVNVNYHVIVKNKITGRSNEFTEIHNMRHFSIPEIDLLARQTGFDILRAEEFLTGNPPSENTWGVNFVLQKK